MKSFLSLFFLLFALTLSAQSPELVIPGSHGYQIFAAEVSPDGKYLATSSSNQVKIWEYRTGRLLKTLTISTKSSFTNTIYHLAFSNDSRFLAAPNAVTFNLIDLTELRVVDKKHFSDGKRKSIKVSAVVAHPTRPEFYFHAQFDGSENLMQYKHNSRELFLNASWTKFTQRTTSVQAQRVSFDPTGELVLVAHQKGLGGALVNTISGTATAYDNALSYLPDGNILSGKAYTNALELSVHTPAGQQVWKRSIRQERYGANKFLYQPLGIDPKTQRFYFAAGDERMITGNYATGADIREENKPGGASNSVLTVAPGGRLVVTNTGHNWIGVADAGGRQIERKFGADVLATMNIATDPGGRHVAVAAQSGIVQVFELTNRGPKQTFRGQLPHKAFVHLAPGGKFLATEYRDQTVHWGNTATGQLLEIQPPFPKVQNVAVDTDGNLAVACGTGLAYYRSGTTRPAWTLPWGGYKHPEGYNYTLAFSKDGKTLVSTEKTADDRVTRCLDAATGRVKWTYTGWFENYVFTPDGATLIGGSGVNDIVRINARNGKEISRITRTDGKQFNPSFDARTGLMTGKDDTYSVENEAITTVDTRTGKVQKRLEGHLTSIQSQGFLAGDLLLSTGFDNTMRLWSTTTGRELGKLFLFENGEDWVVLSPDGRFDATPAALSQLYYRVGTRIVELEQLYESFYTPGLLGQLMNGQGSPPVVPVSIGRLAEPPVVTISFQQGTRNLIVEDDTAEEEVEARTRDAKIVVRAVAPESTVAEIRLYHNGKLLGNSRGLGVEDDPVGEADRTYPVQLLPGENIFRAVALNKERTESAPALLTVRYTAPAAAPTTPTNDGITLHLLTVGINEYKNPRYNLNYAAADAAGLETALKTGMSGIVANTRVHSIRNAAATRTDILRALKTVTDEADADDVFVFYYAGHGVMSEGQRKDFFLVPHDVTQLYGNDEGLAAKGISATELKGLAAAVPAQKQLYILDACQSAGAVQSIALRGAAEEKAIAQLARSTGTHWLTASGSEQFASEFDQLGHGAFTYVLLEALAGKAAGADNRVSVNELKAYLDAVVPEITEKYNGQAQYPASYGFGQDFPVGVKE